MYRWAFVIGSLPHYPVYVIFGRYNTFFQLCEFEKYTSSLKAKLEKKAIFSGVWHHSFNKNSFKIIASQLEVPNHEVLNHYAISGQYSTWHSNWNMSIGGGFQKEKNFIPEKTTLLSTSYVSTRIRSIQFQLEGYGSWRGTKAFSIALQGIKSELIYYYQLWQCKGSVIGQYTYTKENQVTKQFPKHYPRHKFKCGVKHTINSFCTVAFYYRYIFCQPICQQHTVHKVSLRCIGFF